MNKRIILTGSSGHLGSTLLNILKNSSYEINALIMPGQKKPILASNIHYFEGDIRQITSLEPLFITNSNEELYVIHAAAIISITSKMNSNLYNVNVNGTKNIISLCLKYHVKKLIQVSSVHALPTLPDHHLMSEINIFDANKVHGAYAKTKAMAASLIMAAIPKGLNAILVFPSGIIGPNDEGQNHLIQLFIHYLKHSLPFCINGGYDFVDVRDVAQGIIIALEKGKIGSTYLLTGHYSTIKDLLLMLNPKKNIYNLPRIFAYLSLPFINFYCSLKYLRPLYTSYSLSTLKSNSNFSSQKAIIDLGYNSRPLIQSVNDTKKYLISKHLV